ncbi:MAG: protein phosphatase 2C domain-containing protein [Roseburia sp.]|nr:protein phosphatase 2C domain-containing protein [Roseburia sp.]MCM1096841.1 protein phosphatase 2C domain-containing protein [Ruminococcus flavefaciens]
MEQSYGSRREAGGRQAGYDGCEEWISVNAVSLQGARTRQEDYLLWTRREDRIIAVVCDGIGGMDNGDIASRTAAQLLFADLGNVPPGSDMPSFFRRETEKLDDAVFSLQYPDGSRMKAGTTVVAVLLLGKTLHWFSVGDSRLYLLRNGRLQCLTKAHNYAAALDEMKKQKTLDEAWYREEAKKGEWLTSYLGMGIAEQFDCGSIFFPAAPQEKLLVCSDGLYKTVCQEELELYLRQPGGIDRISGLLQEAIRKKDSPSQDNASWVLIGRKDR